MCVVLLLRPRDLWYVVVAVRLKLVAEVLIVCVVNLMVLLLKSFILLDLPDCVSIEC